MYFCYSISNLWKIAAALSEIVTQNILIDIFFHFRFNEANKPFILVYAKSSSIAFLYSVSNKLKRDISSCLSTSASRWVICWLCCAGWLVLSFDSLELFLSKTIYPLIRWRVLYTTPSNSIPGRLKFDFFSRPARFFSARRKTRLAGFRLNCLTHWLLEAFQ